MLHLPHHTYALLDRCQPAGAQVRHARGRRWAIRRRLRELLGVPALRSPMGLHYA
jgi:hypothetical protein